MHCDRHVIKMILETAQILSTNQRLAGIDLGYKLTHKNHPCTIWARTSKENFEWLKALGASLIDEHQFRYPTSRLHKSAPILSSAVAPSALFTATGLTPFALAMPDECKNPLDPVESYRNYYLREKKNILQYTRRDPPDWIMF